ncbi:probable tRNA (uracil-O(2)-)-methyltransferase isoform X2 [Sorex fumeus]|uniref:probable tRNA (uracil-O(2)-)-methyltransferase isoform X2 n=1 Tax=Sorex fumeus TaxID=62283 RepID=UPI0024AD5C0B|nr:probable tRNA (uracil-O(2)-)-methyltransferase isoform X2 [Sorex fumeus]
MAEVGRVAVRDPARLPGGFWAAVAVWLERPQVANKRLCGARLEARRSVALGRGAGPGPTAAPGDARGRDLEALWAGFSRGLAGRCPALLALLAGPGPPAEPRQLQLLLRSVIPKAAPRLPLAAPRREMVVQDVLGGCVTFIPLEADGDSEVEPCSVYQLRLLREGEQWFISVLIFCPEKWPSDGVVCPSLAWLGGELLAKLARWSAESKSSGGRGTLCLLPLVPYSRTYWRLKDKYRDLVKVLWEEERTAQGLDTKQSFVDLGCGNGLLVHILNTEGHPGRGIDVRRRKIWDLYGPQTRLEEAAITPGDEMLFPGVDWLIGNHSDELTPWIPVIAARSSFHCRFFVLPCCFFDFVGRFRRRQSQRTQYREYLDFVKEVGTVCGFHVEEDSLRIPSTKRVCLIGRARTYPASREAAIDEQRTRYIRSRQECPPDPTALPSDPTDPQGPGRWLPAFSPREQVERVRNGAALPRELTERVVLQVARLLLARGDPGAALSRTPTWNAGGSLPLAEVACELDRETRGQLRRECGGLQTLLRNHHQVFAVRSGQVRLRDWREEPLPEEEEEEEEEGGSVQNSRSRRLPSARKTRLCWFFSHHPDGCVLPAPRCPFAHGPAELRPAQDPRKRRQQQEAP